MSEISHTKSAHTPHLIFVACALFVCTFTLFGPRSVYAEMITTFIADIELHPDATFTVTEHIAYTFTGEQHGIYRCIPTKHQDKASSFFKERRIDISVESVQLDEKPAQYETINENGAVCIKVGDPNATITGPHLYDITYTVANSITYEEFGGADLYWNVTGNGWKVPIEFVEARVTASEGLLRRERACYKGMAGETGSSCSVRDTETGAVVFSGRYFNSGEGLTVAQAIDRSKIPYAVHEEYKTVLFLVIGGIIALCGVLIGLYRYKTKFDSDAPIIPQYEPYPDVKPMYAGFLFDKRLDPRDITAGIVYLAQQGFIKIKKIDRKVLFFFEVDDYEITLVRTKAEAEKFEQSILDLLFKHPEHGVEITTLNELKGDLSHRQKNAITLRNLRIALLNDLKKQGFWIGVEPKKTTILLGAGMCSFIAIIILLVGKISADQFWIVGFATIIIGALFAGGRRSQKGYEALDHLKGFKQYLSVTEKERFIFHNAPEKNATQFMEYLPYAIAFGVEKQWAKTFEGITIPNPDWYDGGTMGGSVGSFNATALTQSLGGFSSAFATSSGSSGSASSGGGSSGGGSGGGGGGSW